MKLLDFFFADRFSRFEVVCGLLLLVLLGGEKIGLVTFCVLFAASALASGVIQAKLNEGAA